MSLSPITRGKAHPDLAKEDENIRATTVNALFSGSTEMQGKAVKTVQAVNKFLWTFPIASLADVVIPAGALSKFASKKPINIALGLRDYLAGESDVLGRWASKLNALEVKQWGQLGVDMEQIFTKTFSEVTEKVLNSGGKIFFNITSLDLKATRALKNADLYDEGVSYTQWEFNQILNNSKLLKNTEFYENGARVSTEEISKRIKTP
ncbi:MAG: hypothetical protein R2774_01555 [Saprospiraceae bacterium]